MGVPEPPLQISQATIPYQTQYDFMYGRWTNPLLRLYEETKAHYQSGHWLERAVDLSRFPFPIVVTVQRVTYGVGPGELRLVVYGIVLDRERGLPIRVVNEFPMREYGLSVGEERRYFVEMVRRACRELVVHELDECMFVDGVRVFDPHKPAPTYPNPPSVAQQGDDEVRTGPPATVLRFYEAADALLQYLGDGPQR